MDTEWLFVAGIQINFVQIRLWHKIFEMNRVPAHFRENIVIPAFQTVAFVKISPSFALESGKNED